MNIFIELHRLESSKDMEEMVKKGRCIAYRGKDGGLNVTIGFAILCFL